MHRPSTWLIALLACQLGCAQPFGRLNGVLVNPPSPTAEPRPASTTELGRVRVSAHDAQRRMPIRKGDSVATAPDGIGVIALAAGYQIIAEVGTDLTVENPSIFLRVGRVIVKKIRDVRERLVVKTAISAAAVEGTVFIIDADIRGQMRVTVLEGEVKVFPWGVARWRDTTIFRAADRGSADQNRLTRLAALDSAAARAIRRRIASIERAVPPAPSKAFWQKPGFLIPAVALVGGAVGFVLTRPSDRSGTITVPILPTP